MPLDIDINLSSGRRQQNKQVAIYNYRYLREVEELGIDDHRVHWEFASLVRINIQQNQYIFDLKKITYEYVNGHKVHPDPEQQFLGSCVIQKVLFRVWRAFVLCENLTNNSKPEKNHRQNLKYILNKTWIYWC